jgi:hypothetical protein
VSEGIKELEPQDQLYLELRRSLLISFERAGYDYQECIKLTDIAISPVHAALNLAHEAYKIHIEAAVGTLPMPIFLQRGKL